MTITSKVQHKKSEQGGLRGSVLWRVIVCVVFVLVVLFAWYLYQNYEREYRTVYRPISESASSRYFAAGEYLKTKGVEVAWHDGTDASSELAALSADPENAKGRLLIIDNMSPEQTQDADRILAWVRAGGHVLVYSQSRLDSETLEEADEDDKEAYLSDENPILTKLGIYHALRKSFESYAHDDEYSFFGRCRVPLMLGGRFLLTEGDCGQFVLHEVPDDFVPYNYQAFSPDMTIPMLEARLGTTNDKQMLTSFADFIKNPSHYTPNVTLVDGALGAGRITILADVESFANPKSIGAAPNDEPKNTSPQTLWQVVEAGDYTGRDTVYQYGIAYLDNAYLFDYLTKDAKEVWFFANFEHKSLMTILWERFRFGLFAFFFVVVAMLLALPRQFGRQQAVLDDSGRNLLYYFEKIGDYLWQTDKLERQAYDNREALYKRLNAWFMLDEMGEDECCACLAEVLELPMSMVSLALYDDWQSQEDFVMVTRALSTLNLRFEAYRRHARR